MSASFAPVTATAPFASALVLDTSSSATPGTYVITIKGSSGAQVKTSTFSLTVVPSGSPPPTMYTETVSSSSAQGGTTSPAPGTYSFPSGQLLTVTALPASGWSLNHWLLNGNPAGNGTTFSFVATNNAAIEAVFSNTTNQQANAVASVSFAASGASSAQIVVDGTSYALPTSFSWSVGSTHQVSAQSVIATGDGAQLVAAGWHGAVNSSSPSTTFTVKNDMTLIVSYQTEYLVDFTFASGAGTPVAAQNATIYGPQGLVTVTSANSSAWLDSGASYSPLGGTVGGVVVPVVPGVGSFVVDGPRTVTVPLSTFPVSVKVVDLFGQPISGANVTLTTSGEMRFTQVTGSDGLATFDNVPMGWFSATYTYLGVSGSLSSTATGGHTDTVTMALSYPVFTVAVVFAGLVVISAVARWRRGKRVEDAFDGYSNF